MLFLRYLAFKEDNSKSKKQIYHLSLIAGSYDVLC